MHGVERRQNDFAPAPAARAAVRGKTPLHAALACGVFLLLGSIGTYIMVVEPIAYAVQGRSWVQTPCRVVECSVRRHRGKVSPSYSVDIVYEYRAAGHAYRSTRWDFFPSMPSISHDSAASVARLHPRGRMLSCYVNPADPSQAVLDSRIRSGILRGLLPLSFLFIGAAILYGLVRRRAAPPASDSDPCDLTSRPLPCSARRDNLLTEVGVTLLVDGSVFVCGLMALDGWREGRPNVGLTVVTVCGALVGVVMSLAMLQRLLAFFLGRA